MFDLNGKTALVTGAGGFIGGAIARKFHQAGAVVGLTDVVREPAEKLADELGERTHVFTADLGDSDAVDALAKEAESTMGSVDILVNNAGLTRDGLFMRMKNEDWDLVMRVNLTSAFMLSRAIVRGMMKRRYGRIIGMASVVGVTGNPGQANYSASKAGMIAMSKCLAQEVASRNITVNCIAPGFIKTPMTDALNDKQREAITKAIPSGRLGTAEDVAVAAMFLASGEAAYMTGQTLHVNGGLAMI